MKKTKILVPALGLLALSTVASVTGTVAWFTANAKVSVPFSQFQIKKLTSDLGISSVEKLGVTITGTGKDQQITAKKYDGSNYATLTHASVNCDDSNLWTMNSANAKVNQSSKTSAMFDNFVESNPAMAAKVNSSSQTETYYAYSWDTTFTYNVTNPSDKVNLYFDFTSICNYDGVAGDKETGMGFRLAMINGNNPDGFVVWSPKQGSTMKTKAGAGSDASCYVKTATTNEAYDATATGNLIFEADNTISVIDAADTGTTNRKDCLGQFTATVSSITVKFIAWFEGEDPNVVDDGKLDTVSATLGFYIRSNAAA